MVTGIKGNFIVIALYFSTVTNSQILAKDSFLKKELSFFYTKMKGGKCHEMLTSILGGTYILGKR